MVVTAICVYQAVLTLLLKKENTLLKIIPGSQLILSVGTTGLMAKGNRPNPEPGRIIRNVSFSWNKNIFI